MEDWRDAVLTQELKFIGDFIILPEDSEETYVAGVFLAVGPEVAPDFLDLPVVLVVRLQVVSGGYTH